MTVLILGLGSLTMAQDANQKRLEKVKNVDVELMAMFDSTSMNEMRPHGFVNFSLFSGIRALYFLVQGEIYFLAYEVENGKIEINTEYGGRQLELVINQKGKIIRGTEEVFKYKNLIIAKYQKLTPKEK